MASGKRILAYERARRALELRKSGATFAQIAEVLSYKSPAGAKAAVDRAMKKNIQEQVLELKELQVERLNHMLLVLWPQVQAADTRAIETALKVMTRLDVLEGTETAKRVEVNVTREDSILVIEGSKDDFISQMRKLAGVDSNGNNILESSVVDADVVEDQDNDVDEP